MKKLLKLITVFTMLVALTGCMKVRYDLVIKDEKTVEGKMTLLIDEEQMGEELSDKEIIEQFKQTGMEGQDIKAIHETVDGKKYSGIEALIPEDETKEIIENIDVKDGKMTYTLTDESFENRQGTYGDVSASDVKKMGFDMIYTITMPGNIESTEIGKKEGNKVTITIEDMVDFKGKAKIVANVSSGSSNTILYAGIAAIVLIAGIVVFVMKKKKSSSNNELTNDIIVENDDSSLGNDVVEQESTTDTSNNDDLTK